MSYDDALQELAEAHEQIATLTRELDNKTALVNELLGTVRDLRASIVDERRLRLSAEAGKTLATGGWDEARAENANMRRYMGEVNEALPPGPAVTHPEAIRALVAKLAAAIENEKGSYEECNSARAEALLLRGALAVELKAKNEANAEVERLKGWEETYKEAVTALTRERDNKTKAIDRLQKKCDGRAQIIKGFRDRAEAMIVKLVEAKAEVVERLKKSAVECPGLDIDDDFVCLPFAAVKAKLAEAEDDGLRMHKEKMDYFMQLSEATAQALVLRQAFADIMVICSTDHYCYGECGDIIAIIERLGL